MSGDAGGGRPRIRVQGAAPFAQPGVYEASIHLARERPTDAEIASKSVPSLWSGRFHLRVRDGAFDEILGSPDNPIPDEVLSMGTAWVVVFDLFSTVHSAFSIEIGGGGGGGGEPGWRCG